MPIIGEKSPSLRELEKASIVALGWASRNESRRGKQELLPIQGYGKK